MDFAIPAAIQTTLDALDEFVDREIAPLQAQDDNVRFFDHRREWARTDFEAMTASPDRTGRSCWARCVGAPTAAGWLRLGPAG